MRASKVDGAVALARWMAEPAPLAARLSLMGSLYRPRAGAAGLAAPEVLDGAWRLGFRFLGRYDMAGIVPFVLRPERERYLDPHGVVVLSARRGTAKGPIEARMSRYSLITYFDDGSCLTTRERYLPLGDTDRAHERTGTGDLFVDHEHHLAAVRRAMEIGKTPLEVGDLETSLGLSHYHDRHLRPSVTLRFQLMRLQMVALAALSLLTLARAVGR